MSIVMPDRAEGPVAEAQANFYARLAETGAEVLTPKQAERQDIRAARIGLVNLMPRPVMEDTELQWASLLGRVSALQIDLVLVRLPDDPRLESHRSQADVLAERYTPFEEIVERQTNPDERLDGLIITGANVELRKDSSSDNPELLPIDEVDFYSHLQQLFCWADSNVHSSIFSCWASHAALHEKHGLERQPAGQKTFGIYEHDLTDVASPFTRWLDDSIRIPHSRWGDIPAEFLRLAGVEVLANNSEGQWGLAQDRNQAGGYNLYMQGHGEYDRQTLQVEHERDKQAAQEADLNLPPEPINYYHPKTGQPRLTWAGATRAVMDNWLTHMYHGFSEGT